MEIVETHRALLSRLLPGEDVDQLAVREGQFHHVVLGAERVVCLARTEAAAARLPARAAVLRALAGLDLGFRAPRPLAEGGDGGPRWLLLSRIPGAPLADGALDHPAKAEAAAEQYAALLTALAAAAGDEAVRAALPTAVEGEWREFAAAVRAELFPLMSAPGRERAARELAALDGLPYVASALVHGDLGAENVLWETAEDGLPRLSGVVDWDEARIGDPAEDLAAVAAGCGEEFRDRVLALTGRADAAALRARSAVIRGTFALQQALYAHRDGDAEELADGLDGYR